MFESKIALQSFSTSFLSLKVGLHCRSLAQVFRDAKEDSIVERWPKFFVIERKISLQSFSTSFSWFKARLHCRELAQLFRD